MVKFSKEKEIDLSNININSLSLLINKTYYKEDNNVKNIVYDFVEFLLKKISIIYSDLFSYFLKRINDTKNFNLDEESLFIEIKSKLLNG